MLEITVGEKIRNLLLMHGLLLFLVNWPLVPILCDPLKNQYKLRLMTGLVFINSHKGAKANAFKTVYGTNIGN